MFSPVFIQNLVHLKAWYCLKVKKKKGNCEIVLNNKVTIVRYEDEN